MRAMLIKGGAFSPPDTWNVLVDGYRYAVQDESYGVASAVCDAINHPERWAPTEAYDIAEAYRTRDPLPRSR